MPLVLFIHGWRFFFYANENNEPMHIHCVKAEKECKFWIDEKQYEIKEAYCFNMNSNDKRIVRKIIFEYFDSIVQEWNQFEERKK